jgi:hypothetical protein
VGSIKAKVYHTKPHTLAKLECNMEPEIVAIPERELKSVAMTCLRQCLGVGVNFNHLL